MRQEKLLGLWRRYGVYMIGGLVAIIATVGGVLIWQDQNRQAAEKASTALAEAVALAANQPQAGLDMLGDLARSGPATYRAIAATQQAAGLLRTGDRDGALRAYDRIAADSDLPQDARDLARLSALYLQFDTLAPEDTQARLAPLLVVGNPWRLLAQELNAYALLKSQKRDEARRAFQALADDLSAPPGLRARAGEMLAALGEGQG